MVDSISGNAASLSARLGLQLSGGRDPIDGKSGRIDAGAVERPSSAKATNNLGAPNNVGEGPGLVSEGRAAARRMAAEPPVDSARVSELRDAIASGRYRIDAERIADAMLRSEPGLARG